MGDTELVWPLTAAVDAFRTRHLPGRARLHIVAPAPEGPVSPELVLVDPELARAARAALPDRPAGPPAVSGAEAAQARVPGELLSLRLAEVEERDDDEAGEPPQWSLPPGSRRVPFDTRDRRLRRLGIRLECRLRRRASRWTLVLPRGEVVKARGSARPDATPPIQITGLLRGIVGVEPLVPVRWHSDHPDFARLEAFVLEQRDAMLRHEPGTRLGLDSENLHQFRVADRRLRAALRAGRRLVDRAWADSVRRQLAELGAVTGPVRDLDVMLGRVGNELGHARPTDRRAAEALLDALRAERETRQDDLLRTLDSPEYRRLLDVLEAPPIAAERRPTRSLRELGARELYRLVEEVRALGRSPSDHELHRVRITVKRVRYAVELAGSPTKRHRTRVIDAARSIQDLLGAYQDTVVTENHLRRLSQATGDGSVGFVAGLLAERERRLRRRLKRQLPPAWKQLRWATRAIRT